MTYDSEKILPYKEQGQKKVQVERMFDSIAGAYDRLNRTLSLGIDRRWRKQGLAYLRPFHPQSVLDIATGTGDLAIAAYRMLTPQQIIGADLSERMMEIGRAKVAKAGYDRFISFEKQDGTCLSYADNRFDAVTVGFGVRNYEQIAQGIAEIYRVLKPGGHVMILELSSPETCPMKQLYALYSATVIPYVGWLFSKEKAAYDYLPASIRAVPQGKEMQQILIDQGFADTNVKTFTFGVCSLYTGQK